MKAAVTVAYARADRALAERLAQDLESNGHQVATAALPGKRGGPQTEGAVVLVWSRHAARLAKAALNPAPTLLARVEPTPAPRGARVVNLTRWRSGERRMGLRLLEAALAVPAQTNSTIDQQPLTTESARPRSRLARYLRISLLGATYLLLVLGACYGLLYSQ